LGGRTRDVCHAMRSIDVSGLDEGPVLRLRAGAASWQEADGEVIVLDLQTSDYLGVNAAGTTLWTRLADGTTEVALVAELVGTFGIDEGRAADDVRAFLADARARGLLE
jgi:hypothetical protein